MPHQVIAQILLQLKLLPALLALMLVLAFIDFHVYGIVVTSQIMRMGELLVALLTAQLRFRRMHDLLVLLQTDSRMEQLVAQIAFHFRIRRRMDLHMLLQILVVFELFQALRTVDLRLERRVDVQHVPLHVMARFERHRAEDATVTLHRSVLGLHVPVQVQMVLVNLQADVAFEFLFIGLVAALHVVSQFVRSSKLFAAFGTLDLRQRCRMDSFNVQV